TSDIEPITLEIAPPSPTDEGDASDVGGGDLAGTVSRGRLAAALSGDMKGLSNALGRLDLAAFATRGGSARFHWKTAGRLAITLTAPAPKPKKGKGRAAAKRAKRIVVARGSASRSSAGSKTVRVKLTKAGRALLRKAKRVKLTLVATFRPTHGQAVTSRRTVTLKRRARGHKRR
ncbi:MAG TPA: hypothetical protein VGI54_05935, partial [Solirubrobacteraceae bacterium]